MALTWEKHPVDGPFATEIRCACGCGNPTSIAARSRKSRGVIKGQPMMYVSGHNVKPSERLCNTCNLTKGIEHFSRRSNGKYRVRCEDCRQKNADRREPPIQRRPDGEAWVRDEDGRKRCASCQEWKSESDFYRWKIGLDGLTIYCKRCRSRMERLYRYGISASVWDELLEQQDHSCAICMNPFGTQKICIDHDHSCCPGKTTCGKCIRGLLCDDCNHGLGFFRDSIDRMRCAIKYLENAT